MKQTFEYFTLEELGPNCAIVDQIGYIDLRVAYATGVVRGDLSAVEGDFNGIDDPKSMIGNPDDVFSSIRAAKTYKEVAASGAKSPVSPSDSGAADA